MPLNINQKTSGNSKYTENETTAEDICYEENLVINNDSYHATGVTTGQRVPL